MRNLRIAKASKLMIGTRRPNILIPIMYGSIARVLGQNLKGDLDEAIQKAIKDHDISNDELSKVLTKYETLSHQVKRRWSGEDYPVLMQIATFAEAAKRFLLIEHEVTTARKYLRHGFKYALGPIYPSSYAGFQDPCPIPDPDMPHPCPPCPTGCCSCVPEPGGSPGPEAPPNRYIWEFGPSLHCYDPYEDLLGDDLYAVYAYGDGSGNAKLDLIPKTDETNDLDGGENGTWAFPQRLVYNGLKPDGYLHIEIDIWEQDYTGDVVGFILQILSAIAPTLGRLIGGAAGGAIGSLVGQALDAARSQISDNDDDNYLGKVVFDYPQGSSNLSSILLAGGGGQTFSNTFDWVSTIEHGVHYQFSYSIRDLGP
jgi:hypothetical protein